MHHIATILESNELAYRMRLKSGTMTSAELKFDKAEIAAVLLCCHHPEIQ